MIYSEAAYFERDHCQHCADREEHLRLERARSKVSAALRGASRGRRAYRDMAA